MANLKHIELLKQSVEEWNQWRLDNEDIQPDLSEADLSGRDWREAKLSDVNLSFVDRFSIGLSRVDLSTADLSSGDLHGADLSTTKLVNANLSDANLSDANLSRATLINADLRQANLSGANLNGAFILLTNLSRTYLHDANLSNARIGQTIFAQVDLSTVKGLGQLIHASPSTVELHTVSLPQDGSALDFLRGVGTPDEWIDFYYATMMNPIQYYSCFLSYSSADNLIAKRLHADLQANGVRCWFAPHDLKPGKYVRKEIDQAIHLQDKLLLILSESAVKSGWVSYEVELALAREMRLQREILFPIRLDNEVLQSKNHWATTLQATRHIGNFTNWTDPQTYQQAFDRLLRELKKGNV